MTKKKGARSEESDENGRKGEEEIKGKVIMDEGDKGEWGENGKEVSRK